MDVLLVVIVLALVATVATMGLGLMAMAEGRHNDRDFAEPLMWARIGFQVLTLLLLCAAVFIR